MKQLRVLIADDQIETRKVVREYLKYHPTISVVGEACDGVEAVYKVGQLHPDMVLVGLGTGGAGTDAARIIKQHWPATRVVVAADSELLLTSARMANADGFVLKSSLQPSLQEILRAISDPVPEPPPSDKATPPERMTM